MALTEKQEGAKFGKSSPFSRTVLHAEVKSEMRFQSFEEEEGGKKNKE